MAAPILQQMEPLRFRLVALGAHSTLSNRPERLLLVFWRLRSALATLLLSLKWIFSKRPLSRMPKLEEGKFVEWIACSQTGEYKKIRFIIISQPISAPHRATLVITLTSQISPLFIIVIKR